MRFDLASEVATEVATSPETFDINAYAAGDGFAVLLQRGDSSKTMVSIDLVSGKLESLGRMDQPTFLLVVRGAVYWVTDGIWRADLPDGDVTRMLDDDVSRPLASDGDYLYFETCSEPLLGEGDCSISRAKL